MNTNKYNTGSDLRRLQALLDAARLLNSTLGLKELAGIILEVVRAEVPVDRVSVFVVDRSRKMLHSLVAQELNGSKISLPMGFGIAGTVASTGEILDIPDAYADPRFDRRSDTRLGYHTNDLFALPVFNRLGEVVGVVELLNRTRPIAGGDREFLLGISVYIGLALENAWLHSQVVTREQLEPELASLRDRLADTERLSIMSEMFHGVVREINNPLTLAMGYAELARDQSGVPPEVLGYLEQIIQGIDQTATAARKFRVFLDKDKHERTSVDLGGALRQLSELRSREWDRNHIQTALILESAPPVLADEDQLQLVLLYLIKHAEDAVMQSDSSRDLRIHLYGTKQQVRVEIHVSGPGGTADLQPDQLAIASSIVQKHQGHIRFQSVEGEGMTCIVELPTQNI